MSQESLEPQVHHILPQLIVFVRAWKSKVPSLAVRWEDREVWEGSFSSAFPDILFLSLPSWGVPAAGHALATRSFGDQWVKASLGFRRFSS